MADDIIQRIVIQGAEETASIFNSIGDAATQAWNVVKQAFAGIGDAISNAGSAVKTFVQSFREGFSGGLTAEMEKGRQALAGTSQALAGTSQALKTTAAVVTDAGTAFNVTRGEMRLMHEIAGELGVGPLAQLGIIFGRATLELGLMAAGAVAAALALATLVKFADDATQKVAALGRLADISGQAFEDLSASQVAFQKLGVGADQFTKEFTNLELEINKGAPQVADQLARSADTVQSAFLKIQTAALNTRQVFQQGLQLNLQTQQLALQAQQLQLQLQYQQQNFAIQQRRADLTVRDAEANVRILSLKQQLRNGDIDEQEFAERMAQEEEAANKRALEKAKLDRDAAVLAKQQLAEQQQLQARQLQLQILQGAQQQEANALAKEANQIAQQRAAIDKRTADQDFLKIQANDLAKVVSLMKQLADGQKNIDFGPLTTLDTKIKAVEATLDEAQKNGKKVQTVLADILKGIPSTADAFSIGRALGLDDKSIAEMRAKGGAFIQEMADKAKAANQALTDSDRERFAQYEEELNRIAASWNNFKTQLGTGFVSGVTWLDDFEKSAQKLGRTLGEVIPAAFNTMKQVASDVLSAIGGWISSLIDKAVQLLDALKGAQNSSASSGDTGGIPMASGGLVSGPGTSTSDSIFARLSRGEFVINARAVQHFGSGFFAGLNALGRPTLPQMGPLPAFAGGGMVGGTRTLNLTIGAETFRGLTAPENIAQQLERAAISRQTSSTGIKPRWSR